MNVVENSQTSHQAISEFKGKWYFVYHNGALPGGNGFHRSVCIEEFSLNPDGTIPLLTSTKEGVRTSVANLNPFERVEAETMAGSEGIIAAENQQTGVYLSKINKDDFIKVRRVDFGKGANQFAAQATATSDGNIQIWLDGLNGTLIGTCKVKSTGGLDTWSTLRAKVKKVKGVHDLYFVFKGGDGEFLNFDWWRFQ